MIIRTYKTEDEKSLIKLWSACGLVVAWNDPKKDIQRKLEEEPGLFFIGTDNDELIGSCMAGFDGHRGWIYYLAVKPEFQKKRFATQLIKHAEKKLLEIGCPKINLMVRKSNTSVLDFYKAIGYHDDPVVVLSKRLEDDGKGM